MGSVQAMEDWKILDGAFGFQSHLGSIQTKAGSVVWKLLLRFQSHLGSIQTTLGLEGLREGYSVSIPPWFDSNSARGVSGAREGKFQSHLGSIQTRPVVLEQPRHVMVSIPPWFDSNWGVITLPEIELPVSIPPWFDSNLVQEAQRRLPRKFQSHLG